MARQVVVRPQAEDELLEIQRWYESRAAGLGTDFAQVADALVARIAESPLAFPRVHGDTRRAVMSRFPYAIYFRLDFDDVVVLAVHGKQHPSKWQNRK